LPINHLIIQTKCILLSIITVPSGGKKLAVLLACLLGCQQLMAQTPVPLTDLSFFQGPSSNWKLAAGAQADLDAGRSFNH
jgi:hypothetical protein